MSELTDEQLRVADSFLRQNGYAITPGLIGKLALLLQMPWDEPTQEEVGDLRNEYVCGVKGRSGSFEVGLKNFVANRNAALFPKPPDPRLNAVICALQGTNAVPLGHDITPLATKILAALDEVKS